MNINTQAKILRALESKTFQRIGGGRTLHMDVRLIASTNKNLEQEIEKGNFRQDLFFRLNVIPIHVPPLRERKGDVPLLVDTFFDKMALQSSDPKKTLSQEALELLDRYHWQGNVRELKNLVERLYIMVKGDKIGMEDIPQPYNPEFTSEKSIKSIQLFNMDNLELARKRFELEFICKKVDQDKGDLKATAKRIGTSVHYIKKKMSSL
jgi:two-component system nitrogen regulation response regulator NtrX